MQVVNLRFSVPQQYFRDVSILHQHRSNILAWNSSIWMGLWSTLELPQWNVLMTTLCGEVSCLDMATWMYKATPSASQSLFCFIFQPAIGGVTQRINSHRKTPSVVRRGWSYGKGRLERGLCCRSKPSLSQLNCVGGHAPPNMSQLGCIPISIFECFFMTFSSASYLRVCLSLTGNDGFRFLLDMAGF